MYVIVSYVTCALVCPRNWYHHLLGPCLKKLLSLEPSRLWIIIRNMWKHKIFYPSIHRIMIAWMGMDGVPKYQTLMAVTVHRPSLVTMALIADLLEEVKGQLSMECIQEHASGNSTEPTIVIQQQFPRKRNQWQQRKETAEDCIVAIVILKKAWNI